ncbi:MAG: LPS assembly lipoprotein LptE [Candidatus Eisenbacteria bacterium]
MRTGRFGSVCCAALAVAAAWVGLDACGYSFSGTSLPSHIASIAIPVFHNETLDATIASETTQGITERFVQDNRLKLARETNADCVLEGKVTGYERNVYSYSSSQEPEEYIVVVRLAIVLKDRVKNRDLWSDENLTATATYPAGVPASTGEATSGTLPRSEEEARRAAIGKLAQDILARTLEQW